MYEDKEAARRSRDWNRRGVMLLNRIPGPLKSN
jgi:hypothetical protein